MGSARSPVRSLTVVAAVIRDRSGRMLLTRRPEGRHMGGLWEFPGGKMDDDVSPADALIRELEEELGLEVAVERPLTFAVHEEPGLRILLLFFTARILNGVPASREGQKVRWVTTAELSQLPTPPADAELVRLLTAQDTA